MTIQVLMVSAVLLCSPTAQRKEAEAGPGLPASSFHAPLSVQGQLLDRRQPVPVSLGVVVELRRSREVLHRAEVRSDEQGAFQLELPRPVGDDLLLVGWVQNSGYQRIATTKHVDSGSAEVALNLKPRQGATALLRIVDVEGREVLADSIELDPYETPTPSWGRLGFFWTDYRARPGVRRRPGTGEFELSVRAPTEAYLLARAAGHGAGVLRVSLDPSRENEVFDVVLEGSGTLHGTLTDPVGRRLPGVELTAYSVDWLNEQEAPGDLAIKRGPPRELSGGGLASCSTTTDADGRFEFRGLRPGSYFVQDARPERDALRFDLPRTRYATDTAAIALVVRRYTVELTVADSRGDPLAGLRPYCVRLPEVVKRGWRATDPRGDEFEPGTWRFEVEEDQRYACGWIDPEHGRAERTVEVGGGEYLQRIDLRAAEHAEPATLVIEVRESDGRPYERQVGEDLWVGVRSVDTGKELVAHEFDYDEQESVHVFRLPSGEYTAFGLPALMHRMCGMEPVTRIDHLTAERRFSLSPGEERRIVLRPALGGRVRLRVRLPDDVRDPRLVSEHLDDDDADWPRRNDLLILGDESPCSRVSVLEPDGPRRIPFFYADTPTSSWGDLLVPGTQAVSVFPLPTGPVRLRVETPEFEPVECTVEIREREVVDASVQLRYRDSASSGG